MKKILYLLSKNTRYEDLNVFVRWLLHYYKIIPSLVIMSKTEYIKNYTSYNLTSKKPLDWENEYFIRSSEYPKEIIQYNLDWEDAVMTCNNIYDRKLQEFKYYYDGVKLI